MGFLSLFSKRIKSDKQQSNRLVKSQPYESTVASLPPTRGAYPVAGNGPPVIESLSRSSKFSQSHLSLTDSSAPAPTVPWFRDQSRERPSTAPNGLRQTADASREHAQKKEPLKAPPVSFRKSRVDSLIHTTRPGEPETHPATWKPLPEPPRAPFAHQRTFSMMSEGSKIFVDLLDAQSEIKPADFKSRVKAAGARDYGEDVADRNLGENGVDLDSTQVKAFYAAASPGPGTQRLHRATDDGLYHHITKQISMESGLRSKTVNSSRSLAFPVRTSSNLPHQPLPAEGVAANTSRPMTAPANRASRRQSLNTYVPGGSSSGLSSPLLKIRPKSFSRAVAALKDPGLHISPRRANHAPGWDTTSPELDSASTPVTNSTKSPQTPDIPQDLGSLAKGRPALSPASSYNQKKIVPTDRFHFHFEKDPPAPTSKQSSHRGSLASPAFTSPSKRGSTRYSLHTLQSSISSSVASQDTVGDFTPLAYPNNRPRYSKVDGAVDSAVDMDRDAAPSPCVRSRHSRDDSRDNLFDHRRTKSLVPSLRPSNKFLDEIEDVPVRTSSIRNWSITSATPTTSSSSSHTYGRTHSLHTANTSVDLTTLPSMRPSSRSSLNSGFGRQSFKPPVLEVPLSPVKASSPGFNIDDYLSSDDDSFTSPTRPRGENEEALLFRDDGYGFGTHLPGLSAAPAPEVRSRPRSFAPGSLRATSSTPMIGARRQRRYIIDPSLEEDDDYSDGEDLARRGLRFGHGFATFGDDVIEEERLEKIDVAAAVRMRKEAKARNRALAMAKRRSTGNVKDKDRDRAKDKMLTAGAGDMEDEGWGADVEQ